MERRISVVTEQVIFFSIIFYCVILQLKGLYEMITILNSDYETFNTKCGSSS